MHWTTIVRKSSGETINEREKEVAMVLTIVLDSSVQHRNANGNNTCNQYPKP